MPRQWLHLNGVVVPTTYEASWYHDMYRGDTAVGLIASQWIDHSDSEPKQLIPRYVSGRYRSRTRRLSMDRPLLQYTQAAGITLCVDEMLLPHSPPLNGSVVLAMHQSSWYHHTSQRDTSLRPTTSQRNALRDYTPEPLILPQRC